MSKLQDSESLLSIGLALLAAIWVSGGQYLWENPSGALSLGNLLVRDFLWQMRGYVSQVAACSFGLDSRKAWVFISSIFEVARLASVCSCSSKHPSFSASTSTGSRFPSQATAEYPKELVNALAGLIRPYLSTGPSCLAVPWHMLVHPPSETTRRCHLRCPDVAGRRRLYIGRGTDSRPSSSWCNPYKLSHHPREHCIKLVRRHLRSSPSLRCALPHTIDCDLLCHCDDGDDCHGDVTMDEAAMVMKSFPAPLPEPGLVRPARGFTIPDGGGVRSTGDWSVPPPLVRDRLAEARRGLIRVISESNLVRKVVASIYSGAGACAFSDEDLQAFRELFCRAGTVDQNTSWQPPERQHFSLHVLLDLSESVQDQDGDVVNQLLSCVSLGFFSPIFPSGVWRPRDPSEDTGDADLRFAFDNWSGAEENPQETLEPIEKEISKGFVEELAVDTDVRKRWPKGVAFNKINLVRAVGKSPRIVIDATISDVNPHVDIREKTFNPGPMDVDTCFHEQFEGRGLIALIVDVSDAHKSVRVKEEERGLLLFTFTERLFCYVLCQFWK